MKSQITKFAKIAGTLLTAAVAAVSFAVPVFGLSAEISADTSANAAILIQSDTGDILFSKNANERLPMASTTKIMTAIVALESGNPDRTVEVSPSAVGVEGSSVYLHAGEKLTVRELVYALMLESANDAAEAIAVCVGGDIEGFSNLMNQKALELGLENTHFDNPHGLDSETHYTTAADLAKLTAYCMKNTEFRRIVSTVSSTIPLDSGSGVRFLHNHNRMLTRYTGAIGVKTGFTKRSGRCLVSAAERDNVSLIAVTLNAPDDWNDHTKMLDAGFDSLSAVCVFNVGELQYNIPIVGGASDCVTVNNPDACKAIVEKQHGKIETQIELPRFVFAPIEKSQTLGYIVCTCDGSEILRVPLCACYSVELIE